MKIEREDVGATMNCEQLQILIVHQGAIGDFILSLPAIAQLRKSHPDSFIEAIGFPHILSLIDGQLVNKISPIDGVNWGLLYLKNPSIPKDLADYLSGFDLCVNFTKKPNSAFEENLRKAGIAQIRQIKTFPPAKSCPRLRIGKENKLPAIKFLKEHGLNEKILIAIHPGSGGAKKIWEKEKFIELMRKISVGLTGHIFLITSGPAEEPFIEDFLERSRALKPISVRNLPLPELASILERCSVYIGGDCGITHLAAALSVPTIAIFLTTDPEVWAPRGKNVHIIARTHSHSEISADYAAKAALSILEKT